MKSGSALFDDAAELLERPPVAIDDAADLGFERDAAEPVPPRHAHALEVATQRRREAGAVLVRCESGVPGSGPARTLKNSATSATVRAIGPDTESGDHDAIARHAAGRRPEADDVAEGCRIAQRAAGVAAVGDRHHAARERHRRAAAAAATGLRQVVGIPRRAETVLNVCDPAPNSGVFVLPMVIAPAARMRVTISASRVGTMSR